MRVQAPLADLETVALCHPMDYIIEIKNAVPKEGLVQLDADTSMSPGSFGRRCVRSAARRMRSMNWWARRPRTPSSRSGRPATTPKRPADGFLHLLTRRPSPRATPSASMACIASPWSISTCITATARKKYSGAIRHDVLLDASDAALSGHRRISECGDHDNIVNAPVARRRRRRAVPAPRWRRASAAAVVIRRRVDRHLGRVRRAQGANPLANLQFVEEDFAWATRKIMEVADKTAEGRVVSCSKAVMTLKASLNPPPRM